MSRGTQERIGSPFLFAYGAFTPYGGPFQGPSAKEEVSHSLELLELPLTRLATPLKHRTPVH